MGLLRLAFLGTPEVRHERAAITFPTRKALALLAYLVVERGTHSREKLTALLWPDSDPMQGRATLRYTLAALRGALRDAADRPHLVVDRHGIAFNFASAFEADLYALDAAQVVARAGAPGAEAAGTSADAVIELARATELCRGQFLDGFSLRDAPEFDEWASLQREAWHRRTELVLDRLSEQQEDGGSLADALDVVGRWLTISPLNERAHRRLMRLYLAIGDRSAALRAYEACRSVLARELETEPAPETEALAQQIRAGASVPPRRGPAREQRSAPLPTVLLEGPLIGRASEFVRLVELYHAARQGQPQVVAVQGEAGIGKTRLVTELLRWAAGQAADVLQGRAFETGGGLPYQPLVDALRPRVERENAPDDLLGDIWLAELSRLLPELRERYPDLPPPAPDETTARTRLYEAVVRLVRALAERAPVVLYVDDVQWADAASLDVLHYAGRRWAESGTPVLMLLCLRLEAVAETPALGQWLMGLERNLTLTRIGLGPLTFDDTRHLLEKLGVASPAAERVGAGDPEREAFGRWLYAETGGQPFFLAETLRALLERGVLASRSGAHGDWALELPAGAANPERLRGFLPPGVRQVISARLDRLTPTARTLLTAAAVLGQGFTFELLCRVADVPETGALPAADELLRAHLLRETADDNRPADAYLFAHDKIRDVAYAEASEARRRVFHRRALEALEGTAAAELARHAAAAGLDGPSARFSLQAGDEAMRLLAARDAIVHYERAMAIAERLGWTDVLTDAHARRGRAFASVAMWAEAKRDLEDALEALGDGQHERRITLLLDLSEVCFWLGQIGMVHRRATEVLHLAEVLGRADLELAARGWLGGAHGADGDLGAEIKQFDMVVRRAHDLGVTPPAHVFTFHALTLYWLGRIDDALERGRASVEAARTANDASLMMFSLPHVGLALTARGRYDEALQVFEEGRRFGREYGLDALLARATAMSSAIYRELYDFKRAVALSHEARDQALSAGWAPAAASSNVDLLFTFARSGNVGQAEQLVDEVAQAVEKAAGFHGWLWRLRLAQARAELALARGDWEGALYWAGEAIGQSLARGRLKYQVLGLGTRAQALVAQARTRDAIVSLHTAVRLARTTDDPALFVRISALQLAIDGDDTLADEARAAARRIVEALPDPDLRRAFVASEPVRALADGDLTAGT